MSVPYATCQGCGGYFWTQGLPPWTCPQCGAECRPDEEREEASEESAVPGRLTPPTERWLFRATLFLTPVLAVVSVFVTPAAIGWMFGRGALPLGTFMALGPIVVVGVGSLVCGYLAAKGTESRGAARLITTLVFAFGFSLWNGLGVALLFLLTR